MAKTTRTNRLTAIRIPKAWITKARYKAFAYVAAIAIAAVATVAFVGISWVPVAGIAVCAAVMSVAKVTRNLVGPTCLSCGHDLKNEPVGVQGVACPDCGAVNSPGLAHLARLEEALKQARDGRV